jgi:hypothetical protein
VFSLILLRPFGNVDVDGFTRSHRYYYLVKEKTQVYVGRIHKKYGCAAGFVEAQFYCFSWGEITEQWSHAPLSHCSLK